MSSGPGKGVDSLSKKILSEKAKDFFSANKDTIEEQYAEFGAAIIYNTAVRNKKIP